VSVAIFLGVSFFTSVQSMSLYFRFFYKYVQFLRTNHGCRGIIYIYLPSTIELISDSSIKFHIHICLFFSSNNYLGLRSSVSCLQLRGRSKSFEPNLQGVDKRAHIYFFNIFIAFVNAQLVTITEFFNASKIK